MKFVYIGIGIAAAVGAGYLAYRYFLSPQGKQEANAVFTEVQSGARTVGKAAKDSTKKAYQGFESQVTP